jgi:hypothetical protein
MKVDRACLAVAFKDSRSRLLNQSSQTGTKKSNS